MPDRVNLPQSELDKFEEWIINPNGLDFSKVVPDDRIQRDNEIMYLRNTQEREHLQPWAASEALAQVPPLPLLPLLPPLPPFANADIEEEKYVQELGNGDVLISNVSSKFAAMAMCGVSQRGQRMPPLSGLVPPT